MLPFLSSEIASIEESFVICEVHAVRVPGRTGVMEVSFPHSEEIVKVVQ